MGSSMLEQAILDAKELKEAAIRNAQQSLVEKYSNEYESEIEKLLEQTDPAAAPVADPAATAPVMPAGGTGMPPVVGNSPVDADTAKNDSDAKSSIFEKLQYAYQDGEVIGDKAYATGVVEIDLDSLSEFQFDKNQNKSPELMALQELKDLSKKKKAKDSSKKEDEDDEEEMNEDSSENFPYGDDDDDEDDEDSDEDDLEDDEESDDEDSDEDDEDDSDLVDDDDDDGEFDDLRDDEDDDEEDEDLYADDDEDSEGFELDYKTDQNDADYNSDGDVESDESSDSDNSGIRIPDIKDEDFGDGSFTSDDDDSDDDDDDDELDDDEDEDYDDLRDDDDEDDESDWDDDDDELEDDEEDEEELDERKGSTIQEIAERIDNIINDRTFKKEHRGLFEKFSSIIEDLKALTLDEAEELNEAIRLDYKRTGPRSQWTGMNHEEAEHDLALANLQSQIEEMEQELEELQESKKKLKAGLKESMSVIDSITKENKEFSKKIGQYEEKLQESRVLNYKLLYTNKVLSNSSLNERQKTKIAESINGARTTEEVKLLYETLQSTMREGSSSETPKSLSEAVERRSSSSILLKASRNAEPKQDDFAGRMKRLAGLN